MEGDMQEDPKYSSKEKKTNTGVRSIIYEMANAEKNKIEKWYTQN
jgi:hypothetical protein